VRKEEGAGRVIKLTSIIALDTPSGVTKLRGHKGEDVRECVEDVRLVTQ
jgi:hypothetical protein